MSNSKAPLMSRVSAYTGVLLCLAVVTTIVTASAIVNVAEHGNGRSRPQLYVAPDNPYVTAHGRDLYVRGKKLRFIGVNAGVSTIDRPVYRGCGPALSDTQVDTLFIHLQSMGITVVRVWLMQSFTASGADFSRFDYLLRLAAADDMYLLPTLENQWPNCTEGGYKLDTWYSQGYRLPYGTYPISYKAYVGRVVTRYRNNPHIIMWQLMNEAECQNANGRPNPQALYRFAKDMSAYIKVLDHHHLVSLGARNGGEPGVDKASYLRLHALPTIDVLEAHLYGDPTDPIPPDLRNILDDSVALNKPVFVGEAGIDSNDCAGMANCYTPQQRARLFSAKINAFFARGGAGYIIWHYMENKPMDSVGFDYRDPLTKIVRAITPTLAPTPTP